MRLLCGLLASPRPTFGSRSGFPCNRQGGVSSCGALCDCLADSLVCWPHLGQPDRVVFQVVGCCVIVGGHSEIVVWSAAGLT